MTQDSVEFTDLIRRVALGLAQENATSIEFFLNEPMDEFIKWAQITVERRPDDG